jgi:hypothetical protein
MSQGRGGAGDQLQRVDSRLTGSTGIQKLQFCAPVML